jgi:GNAT superfamily N-acetyltransferase
MRIRLAKHADAAQLAILSTQLGYPSTAAQIRGRFRLIHGDPSHAVAVAELPGGRLIGWIHVFVHIVLESERKAELGGLIVHEKFRGAGAGTKLLRWAEQWAKAHRLKSVYLRSNIIRKDAHAFYLKQGYRIVKTQYAFLKTLKSRRT